jgi:hypothetical protein
MFGFGPLVSRPLVDVVQDAATGSPYTLTVNSGTVTLTGSSVTLRVARKITVTSAGVTLTGSSVNLKRGLKITTGTAAVTLTGTSVVLRVARKITVTSAGVTLTGTSVNLKRGLRIITGTAAVTTTGTSVALKVGRQVTVTSAPVTLTGTSVALKADRKITVGTAAITIAGSSVDLTYSGGSACVPAFNPNAFYNNAFQVCVVDPGVCIPAFQPTAFQSDAFQICPDVPSEIVLPMHGGQIGDSNNIRRVRDRDWRNINRSRDEIRKALENAISPKKRREAAKKVSDELRAISTRLPTVLDELDLEALLIGIERLQSFLGRMEDADRIRRADIEMARQRWIEVERQIAYEAFLEEELMVVMALAL